MRWYLDEVLLVEDSVVAEDAVDSAPEIGCVGVEREAAGDEILEEEGCDAGAGFEASGFGAGADDLACSVGTGGSWSRTLGVADSITHQRMTWSFAGHM